MTEPQEIDGDLDDEPRAELGERDAMHPVVASALEEWRRYMDGGPSNCHYLGTFLDLLAAEGYRVTPIEASDLANLLPAPKRVAVHFAGGPWNGKTTDVEYVVAPVFAPGHEVGNHYWLDTKSDPPAYHWDGTEWAP